MNWKRRGWLFGLGLVLAAGRGLAAEIPRFLLVDAEGRAVAGARVAVAGRAGSVVTAADGGFRLETLPRLPVEFLVSDESGALLGVIVLRTLEGPSPLVLRLEPGAAAEVTVRGGFAPGTSAPPAAAPAIVTREEIEEARPNRLADILENIPNAGRLEDGQSVVPSVRGFARGRTLILLDDGRVTAERRAGPSGTYLDPFFLENLEVVRGPASVAYGSDAFGGVVHARTPLPRPGVWEGKAELGAASGERSGRFGFEVNFPAGAGAWLLQAQARQYEDYRSPRERILNSGARDRAFHLKGLWPLGAAKIWAGFLAAQGRDIGKPSASFDLDRTRAYYPEENSTRFQAGLDWTREGYFQLIEVRAFAGRYHLDTIRERFPFEATPRKISQSDVAANDASLWAAGTHRWPRGVWRAGVDFNARFNLHAVGRFQEFDAYDRPAGRTVETPVNEARRVDAALFAEGEGRFFVDALSLAAGVRVDRVATKNVGGYFGDRSTGNTALSGHAAVVWRPAPGWEATGQYSRGFRDPLLSDRYFRGISGRGFVTGEPDLEAETSHQFDVAVRTGTGPLRLAVYGFHYRIDDLIERFKEGPDYFFHNRGREIIRGGEVELDARWGAGWNARLALGITRGEIEGDPKPPADIPAKNAVLLIDHRSPRQVWWRFRLAAYARDDRPGPTETETPGFWVADLAGGVPLGSRLEARLALRNLFNRDYPGTPDENAVSAPGRTASLTLAAGF